MNDADDETPPAPRQSFRFSIRQLLLVTAAVAFFVAPISWLGQMYITCLVFSCLMIGAVAISLWMRITPLAVIACGIAFAPILIMFVSSVLMIQAAGTAIVVLATIPWSDRPTRRIVACVLVMVATYSWGLNEAWRKSDQLADLRANWPMVSLADRLVDATPPKPQSVALSFDQTEWLDEFDQYSERSLWGWGGRAASLGKLHDATYQQFALAQGFGVTRMPYLRTNELVDMDPIDPVALPIEMSLASDPAALLNLHQSNQYEFFDHDRMGYPISVDEATGFAPHAFTSKPRDRQPKESSRWLVQKLELIGLLLHDEPVAYVSEHLPNMEELHETGTRPLNEFEARSLIKLFGTSDLEIAEVTSDEGKQVRMLGAIRAATTCTTCHEAPRGALLGAFSYDLLELTVPATSQSHPSTGG